MIVVPRPGFKYEGKNLTPNFELLKPTYDGETLCETHLSSSEVRRRIAARGGGGADGLVPLAVQNHIVRYGLYRD